MLPPAKKQRLSSNFANIRKFFKLEMDANSKDLPEDQVKDATAFCDFYIDLIHSFNDKTKYFLSEDVILDYFGHTVKGQKSVTNFIKSNVVNVGHLFQGAKPVDKIGFRDTHVVKLPKEPKKLLMPLFSPPKINEPKTPTKSQIKSTNSQPSTSGPHNEERKKGNQMRCSPAKRLRLSPQKEAENDLLADTEIVEGEGDPVQIKYMVAEGYVEFRKPSMKKLQIENKWKRPCKLSIAYSSISNHNCTIYLIIYEGNVRCRRNLLKEFDKIEYKD